MALETWVSQVNRTWVVRTYPGGVFRMGLTFTIVLLGNAYIGNMAAILTVPSATRQLITNIADFHSVCADRSPVAAPPLCTPFSGPALHQPPRSCPPLPAQGNLAACIMDVPDDLAFMARNYPTTKLQVVKTTFVSELLREMLNPNSLCVGAIAPDMVLKHQVRPTGCGLLRPARSIGR